MSIINSVVEKTIGGFIGVLKTVFVKLAKLSFTSTVFFAVFPDVLMNKYVGSNVANIKNWFVSTVGCAVILMFTSLVFGGGIQSIGGFLVETMITVSLLMIAAHWLYIRHGIEDKEVLSFIGKDKNGYGIPFYLDLKKDLLEAKNQDQVDDFYKKMIRHELMVKPGVMGIITLLSLGDPRYFIISGAIFAATLWQGFVRESKIRGHLRVHKDMDEQASGETARGGTGSAKNRL